jgi:hypothetical protein
MTTVIQVSVAGVALMETAVGGIKKVNIIQSCFTSGT